MRTSSRVVVCLLVGLLWAAESRADESFGSRADFRGIHFFQIEDAPSGRGDLPWAPRLSYVRSIPYGKYVDAPLVLDPSTNLYTMDVEQDDGSKARYTVPANAYVHQTVPMEDFIYYRNNPPAWPTTVSDANHFQVIRALARRGFLPREYAVSKLQDSATQLKIADRLQLTDGKKFGAIEPVRCRGCGRPIPTRRPPDPRK